MFGQINFVNDAYQHVATLTGASVRIAICCPLRITLSMPWFTLKYGLNGGFRRGAELAPPPPWRRTDGVTVLQISDNRSRQITTPAPHHSVFYRPGGGVLAWLSVLERGADLHMAQLIPLPLTLSCFSKIQIGFTFLVPAHLGSPGKRAVKRVCLKRARQNTQNDCHQCLSHSFRVHQIRYSAPQTP